MRVPLLDLRDEYRTLAAPIRAQIDEVLASQQFILGPKVAEFEQALARACGSPHAIGVSSGTDALLAILMALGIGPGDAVITTPFTFFATAGCIARVGARPVFVEIEARTFNLSPKELEHFLTTKCKRGADGSLLEPSGNKLRAIVPVHLFGLCCDMPAINELAARFGLEVIEDAAQAIGAECPAGQAGAMSAAGYFSFYPSKNLGAAGDAGAIICRDAELAERLRICRQHGMAPRYFHHFIGGNFRLDEMQAAILQVKLPHLNEWSAARRAAADFYREQFKELGLTSALELPAEPYRNSGLANHHIYHQYVVRTTRRDALREHLAQKEIGAAIYYPLGLHEQKCFEDLGYRAGDFPETERATREVLALPIYPALTREEQRYVVESIAEFFR